MSAALFSVEAYRIEESVGFLLARSRAMLAKALDNTLVELEITHAQACILLLLASGKYATATDLVRETYNDAASMKRMLDRLQKRALLRRDPDPDDRRQIHITLTKEGKKLADKLPPLLVKVLNTQFGQFSPEEVGFLKSLLRKFLYSEKNEIEPAADALAEKATF